MNWPVVPICDKQKLDIRPEDLLEDGVFRKFDIYSGGGGYDKFNSIFTKRFGWTPNPQQFVVQLYGYPLHCDYCYVTERGVWGTSKCLDTEELIESYLKTGLDTFHLMGGAPALYLEAWREIAEGPRVKVFHSDFLGMERFYTIEDLKGLPGLYAVSVKKETLKYIEQFLFNLEIVVKSGINFYITFTGVPYLRDRIKKEFGPFVLWDSFIIKVNRKYKALS